jgi:hypothetical protein
MWPMFIHVWPMHAHVYPCVNYEWTNTQFKMNWKLIQNKLEVNQDLINSELKVNWKWTKT